METLELLPIETDAPAAPPATALATKPATAIAPASIKDAAIAHLRAREAAVTALAERYRDVALDLSTHKGLAAGKAARLDLRENGRFAIQRSRDETKDLLNEAKKNVEAEADRLIAIVKPVEDHVHAQIEAREEVIKAEKKKEEARKQAHIDNIAQIVGYATVSAGIGSARLQQGIEFVEQIDVSEDAFEEFVPAATVAKETTLEKLRAALAQALEAERIRAENEQRERAIRRIAEINAHVADGIGEDADSLAQRLVSLKALAPTPDQSGDVMTAYLTATAQLEAMVEQARGREDLQRQLDEMRAAAKPAEAAPAPQVPDEAEKPASEPETAAPAAIYADVPGAPLQFGEREDFGVIAVDAHPVDTGGTGEPAAEPKAAPAAINDDPMAAERAAKLAEWTDGPVHVGVDLASGPDMHVEALYAPLRNVVLPDARLVEAEDLACKVGACQIGPGVWAFDLPVLANLIDAARA